ncbi:PspC domain-containing protein [Kineosporia babensis]|uniref:PspC domain-containing protein n=1 Tax=Kineosporia babensis TaxID=499548 RepID=A0A9X1NEI5_9ACTN|nr:PspC domain-containing protein [Kineosporia babensis]MCD5313522.1 PspC domain-containing protein [Kineosporia babensis]
MSGTQEPGGAVWGTPEPPPNQGQQGAPGPGPAGPNSWGASTPGSPGGPGSSGGPGGPGNWGAGNAAPGAPSGWGPPPEPGSPDRRPGDDFFGRIRDFGAARPSEGRWVAGVASGLARRLDIDQTLIRGGFVALSIVGGIGVALYGICWMLLPQQHDGRIHLQEAIRGRFSAGFFAAVLLSLALVGGGSGSMFGSAGFWNFPGTLVLAGLIVAGLWWMAKKLPQPDQTQQNQATGGVHSGGLHGGGVHGGGMHGGGVPNHGMPHWTTPEGSKQLADNAARWGRETGDAVHAWAKDFSQRSPHAEASWARAEAQRQARARTAPSRRVRLLTLGGALIAATSILIAEAYGDVPGWAGLTALGAAVVVIACGVVANGLLGRRSPGLAALGILLALIMGAGVAAQRAGVDTNQHLAVVGEARWAPESRSAAESQYNLGIGEASLDLTSEAALRGATAENPLEVEANVGLGRLVLTIPDWLPVEVETRLGAGEVVKPDGTRIEVRNDSDRQTRTLTYGSGEPVLKVVAQQGAGQLEIKQEGQGLPSGLETPADELPSGSNSEGEN